MASAYDRIPALAAGLAMFVLGLTAAATPARAQAPPPAAAGEVTFTKDIAPILQRSCQTCHRPGRRRADVARHLRRSAAVGARDQAAHRPRAARRA